MRDENSSSVRLPNFTGNSLFLHVLGLSRGKVGQYSEIKFQNACENEYKKYCLNGGECYYLSEEDIVGCKCTWFYGGKRCGK